MTAVEPQRSPHAPPRRPAAWHRRWAAVVLVLFALVILSGVGELALGTLVPDVHAAYDRTIVANGKEPALLVTLAFLVTFGVVRLITYSIHDDRMRVFRNVTTKSGLHIHHMVPGMVLVLTAGYFGLVLTEHRPVNLLSVLFGMGAALVLDEFALWLRLADVYWQPEGRESLDAVVLAAGFCLLSLLGFNFWVELGTLVVAPLVSRG